MTDPIELHLTVYGTAQPAGSKRAVMWKAKDGRSGTNVIDANPKAGKWKDQIHRDVGAAIGNGHKLLRGPLSVVFRFFVRRPKGHIGSRGLLPSAPARPTVKPDVLKLARAVEDALTGLVWADDAQIVDERLEKHYGEPERVEISVCVLAAESPKPAAVPAAQLSL